MLGIQPLNYKKLMVVINAVILYAWVCHCHPVRYLWARIMVEGHEVSRLGGIQAFLKNNGLRGK
jgi:hypothetical protein